MEQAFTPGNVRSFDNLLLVEPMAPADALLLMFLAYGVYASQLIRYARCCSNYSDFLLRHRALVTRLLSQGYKVNRLSNTFEKFHDTH